MIESWRDLETEGIYDDGRTKRNLRRLPGELWRNAQRKLDQMNRASELKQLAIPPNNRLEMLQGDRQGEHSIRINSHYRICFVWTVQGPAEVEITDYH